MISRSMRRDLATACVLCSHNCGLRVDVDDGRIMAVRPDPTSPMTAGYVCNKAYGLAHYVEHAQRVRHPLRRRPDGSFERVSWDAAIAEIGARLSELLRTHGPDAFGLVGVGGQGNHLDAPYAVPFLLATGSPWWFNALAQEKTQHALVDRWMFGAPATVFLHADAERSAYVLMLGTNPAVSHRGRNATELLRALAADERRTLVVVDPRRTESARRADVHLQVRPGGDVYLLLGMAAHIARTGLVDAAFLRAHTHGWDQVAATLATIDPTVMAARADVPVTDLARVAEGFARAESACIFSDLGVEQTPFSTLLSYLQRLLLLMTGNVGTAGGNVFHGTFSPAYPPLQRRRARARVSGIESVEMFAPIGMFSPSLLAEEIDAGLRAIVVEGSNPVVQAAGAGSLRAALARLDLLVVVDPAMSETARLAHFVLPPPVGYEKWEYSGFPKHYPDILLQQRPPIVPAPDDTLPEAEIYARLARAAGLVPPAPRALHLLARRARTALGAAAYLGALGTLAAAGARGDRAGAVTRATFWAYETMAPHLPAPALAAVWLQCHLVALTRRADVLRARPALARVSRFAAGEALFAELLAHPEGTLVARLDAARNLADHTTRRGGRVDLAPAPMLAEMRRALATPPATDPAYPLVMNGGHRTHWNANTIQRDPAWRKGKGPHCALWMSPADATAAGLADGELARVETRAGAAELPVHVDPGLRAGHVLVPNGFGMEYPDADGRLVRGGVAVNELTEAGERDPFTGCPHHKMIRCRVSRARS